MSPDKRWKVQERRIARLLGLERVGPTGTHGPDLVGKHLHVQVKDRKSYPHWLLSALPPYPPRKPWECFEVVVLTSPILSRDIAVLDLLDFRELLRKAGM